MSKYNKFINWQMSKFLTELAADYVILLIHSVETTSETITLNIYQYFVNMTNRDGKVDTIVLF